MHPLGFDLSEKQVRRAGLDYWGHLDVQQHDNWGALKDWLHGNLPCEPCFFGLTTKTKLLGYTVQIT